MEKIDLSIIIPTKDRPSLIKKTIDQLSKNIFFFKEIIIIDSSNKFIKKKIHNIISNSKLNIKIYDSKASISVQRNLGLKKVKKNTIITATPLRKGVEENIKKIITTNILLLCAWAVPSVVIIAITAAKGFFRLGLSKKEKV